MHSSQRIYSHDPIGWEFITQTLKAIAKASALKRRREEGTMHGIGL